MKKEVLALLFAVIMVFFPACSSKGSLEPDNSTYRKDIQEYITEILDDEATISDFEKQRTMLDNDILTAVCFVSYEGEHGEEEGEFELTYVWKNGKWVIDNCRVNLNESLSNEDGDEIETQTEGIVQNDVETVSETTGISVEYLDNIEETTPVAVEQVDTIPETTVISDEPIISMPETKESIIFPNMDVETEVTRIRKVYNDIEDVIYYGKCYSEEIRDGVTAYYNWERLLYVYVEKGVDNLDYGRYYYYEDGNLIFAFYTADDAYRFYFYENSLMRLRYAEDSDDPDNVMDIDWGESEEYKAWEAFVLNENASFGL